MQFNIPAWDVAKKENFHKLKRRQWAILPHCIMQPSSHMVLLSVYQTTQTLPQAGKKVLGTDWGSKREIWEKLHCFKMNSWKYRAEQHPFPETAVGQGRAVFLGGFHNTVVFHCYCFSPWEKGAFCKASSLKFPLSPNCSNFYFSKYLLFSKFKIIVVARNHLEIFRTKPKHLKII